MGRLIDADKLIILAENTFARPNGFIQLIEETETAYDVEKVVAELEKEKGKVFIDGKEMYQENYFIDIDRAIGMVKRGGAECLKEQS